MGLLQLDRLRVDLEAVHVEDAAGIELHGVGALEYPRHYQL